MFLEKIHALGVHLYAYFNYIHFFVPKKGDVLCRAWTKVDLQGPNNLRFMLLFTSQFPDEGGEKEVAELAAQQVQACK